MSQNNQLTLATFGQLNRDIKYRILTKIIRTEDGLVVRKEAYSKESVPHIKKLVKNHKQLASSVKSIKDIRVVNVLDSGNDFVEFEYIKGKNAEYALYEHILSGEYDKAVLIIERIFELIDNLASTRDRVESAETKKINDIYNYPPSSNNYCKPGVIDLNPDNFILGADDEIVMFDCEWVLDSPVAADYLKTRFLHAFFARRSESFAFLPNEGRIFKQISESGNITLIPDQIYKKYSKHLTKESMKKYWKAEDIFQKLVNSGRTDTANNSIKTFQVSDVSSSRPTLPDIEESLRNDYNQSLSGYKHLEAQNLDLQTSNIELTKQVDRLGLELNRLRSSIPYRIYLKIRTLAKKIPGATWLKKRI